MSAALLLDLVQAQARSWFTPAEVATVAPYGGQFSGAEVERLSFNAPALLLTALGWKPTTQSHRMSGRHLREVHLAAFVVTKHAKRELRLRQAMALAEALCFKLRQWVPDAGTLPLELGPTEEEPRAENLFGPAVDEAGLALWLVSWRQCCRYTAAADAAALWDLLRVEITDQTLQGRTSPDSGLAPIPITVTEDVQFQLLPPSA